MTQAHVDAIATNFSMGASEMAPLVLEAFAAAARQPVDPNTSPDQLLDLYRNFGFQLATCRPSMANMANTAAAVLAAMDDDLLARADPFGTDCAMIRCVGRPLAEPVHMSSTTEMILA